MMLRRRSENKSSNAEKVANYVIIAVTIVITIIAMRYINYIVCTLGSVLTTFIVLNSWLLTHAEGK